VLMQKLGGGVAPVAYVKETLDFPPSAGKLAGLQPVDILFYLGTHTHSHPTLLAIRNRLRFFSLLSLTSLSHYSLSLLTLTSLSHFSLPLFSCLAPHADKDDPTSLPWQQREQLCRRANFILFCGKYFRPLLGHPSLFS
jgi:hypothetical protein